MELKRFVFGILLYCWLTVILLVLFINEIPPFSFLGVNSLTALIEESKLFFIAIIFPLIASRIIQEKSLLTDSKKSIVYLLIFILLSLPLTLLTSYFSPTAPGALLLADLLLVFIVLCQVSLSLKSSDSNISVYYSVFFLFCGIGPVLYYLILEFTKQSWWFLIAINPFWLFWQIKQTNIFYSAWLLQSLIWIGIVILIVFIKAIVLRLNKPRCESG
ncbi:MAG: hypothetical protein V1871_04980 [Planctomycetota bacterium]